MNSATSIAPNSSPLLNTSTLPVAGSSMPYMPLIGALSESTMIRDGVDVDLLVGAGDRRALGVEVVPPAGMIHVAIADEDDQREQDRVRGRQGEPRPCVGPSGGSSPLDARRSRRGVRRQ